MRKSGDEFPSESLNDEIIVQRDCAGLILAYTSQISKRIRDAREDSEREGGQSSSSAHTINQSHTSGDDRLEVFKRDEHVKFVCSFFTNTLQTKSLSLYCSQVWLIYWVLHSLDILGEREKFLPQTDRLICFLDSCIAENSGGFGGGPDQMAHLAPTYAATASLIILGTPESFAVLKKAKVAKFIKSMRVKDGGYMMHEGGEIDMRGTYCAISTASMVGEITSTMIEGLGEYVGKCQRYDGGIAGDIGGEAHAGYTYCGTAALTILDIAHVYLDLPRLLRWVCRRQMESEGGFNGRPNKLVDACYSFWCAGCLPLIKIGLSKSPENIIPTKGHCWLSPLPLYAYLLLCCQPSLQEVDDLPFFSSKEHIPDSKAHHMGGFCDKPRTKPDYYHTCYSLSGMAITQEWASEGFKKTSSTLGHADIWQEIANAFPEFNSVNVVYNITDKSIRHAIDKHGYTHLKICEVI